ncbi:MAG: 2-oxoacid:acceptor oxidoreductase subunit alpha [Acidilobaceae archaeon]|nr:2-oxoacid:acceptor oxidoreductase subunit alpha [Acidilobaceae archaeon]
MTDVSLIIGGPQGGGIESAGQVVIRALVAKGFNVIGTREYHSNIMGAHSYFHLRFTDKPARALRLPVELVVALDAESALTHVWDVSGKGFFVYDADSKDQDAGRIASMELSLKKRLKETLGPKGGATVGNAVRLVEERGATPIGLPLKALLKKVSDETASPLAAIAKTINVMGLAAGLYLLGIEYNYIAKGIELQFGGRPKVLKPNLVAAKVAVDYVEANYGKQRALPDGPHKGRRRMLASGNDIVAMGKVVGGLTFQTFYPITPSSDEAFYVEENMYVDVNGSKASIVVLQAEDELAAVNMILGAAAAGARASTSTSGPGFSLMNEAISMAVMAEIPIVISLWMRAGPSTGIATRQGQQDLLHAIFAGHGDTPKIVVASGDHREAFYDAIKTLNWAEEFQTPVIHLLDKYLAATITVLDEWELDVSKLEIKRGKREEAPGNDYKRYEITEDGISPMAPLGKVPMLVSSLEHDEYGMVTEDPVDREEMVMKRLRKWRTIANSIPEEEKLVLHGDPDARVTLISFGSTKQAILSAMEDLAASGIDVNFLQFRILSPFPAETASKILERSEKIIGVEANFQDQLSFLLRAHTGIYVPYRVRKVNARPLYDSEVVHAVEKIVKEGAREVVVSSGA